MSNGVTNAFDGEVEVMMTMSTLTKTAFWESCILEMRTVCLTWKSGQMEVKVHKTSRDH